MCAACGVLSGTPDWLDRVGNKDGIGAAENDTRAAERQRLVKMVNKLLYPGRSVLSDFGEKLMIKGATGRMEVVDNLAHVWLIADQMGGVRVDPLSESYLAMLRAEEDRR